MSANATAKNYLLNGPGDWDAFEPTACWVAFPEKAPKNMYPSQKQRDLFTQRLEDKKEVRELFEQLQSKESTANEKDS
ncbi:unnamed protein product [Fusarium langsethiae]|nr:unnamed protein product [Fusarium langsethiae]